MIRVHIHIYTLLYVYIIIELHCYSSVAACIVGTQVDIQYTIAVLVHVPGTYIYTPGIYIIVHILQQQTATAAVAVL